MGSTGGKGLVCSLGGVILNDRLKVKAFNIKSPPMGRVFRVDIYVGD
jgi:hypothetical protein